MTEVTVNGEGNAPKDIPVMADAFNPATEAKRMLLDEGDII